MKKEKRSGKGKRLAAILMAGFITFGSIPATTLASDARIRVVDLTTEYLVNPLGIDTDSVHFGWKMESNKIGTRQTAYEIQVYEQENSATPVWDSGKVESDNSVGIEYGGSTLKEATQYNWIVTVWNELGEKFQSDPAQFETGVTNQADWNEAQFIRMNNSSVAPIFRTEKQLLSGKAVSSARLYITALGVYQAYVNGSRVGEAGKDGIVYHHMNPGYGNGNVSLEYQTYDVTPLLQGNTAAAVSIIVGTGWFNGMSATSSQPAVKAMMAITYNTGERQVFTTNTSDWKGILSGPVTANGVYYGEDYDARFAKSLGDFTQPGYNDSNWAKATSDIDIPRIENTFTNQNSRYVRLSVSATGPATNNDKENRLQIMELELLDQNGNNVVVNKVPTVNSDFTYGTQWAKTNLTDGDNGVTSDKGYTSNILTTGQTSYTPSTPITIDFDLGQAVSFQTLRMYPRTKLASNNGTECPNYPKRYTIQVSSNGSTWTDVATYEINQLTNTVLYPDKDPIFVGNNFIPVTTQNLRISVSATGPANKSDNENRLQLMELQLLDGTGQNVAAGITPTVSNIFTSGTQWMASNLTNGDYGISSNAGYTSQILDYGKSVLKLAQPITFDFHFNEPVCVSSLKMFVRTKAESISGELCLNYPKVYSVQTSSDGGQTWTDVLTNYDSGMVKNTVFYSDVLSTTTYPGKIHAQKGLAGKIIDKYGAKPVSVVLYTGKAASSSYTGGEVNVDKYYAYEAPTDTLYSGKYQQVESERDLFDGGITLKKGQSMVVNMGQNMTAVPEIECSGAEGTQLTMSFGEMLNDGSVSGSGATQADGPKGSIYLKSLRGARSKVNYVFSGDGIERYQTAMSFFGYQYIGIMATEDVTIYSLRSRALSSVSEQTGYIETNNENVNKLFSNVIYGQLSNYFTTATDCPQRDERLFWTGDTQAFAQTAVYNFDSLAFLNSLQDIMSENTMIKGYVPSVGDQVGSQYFNNWSAGWSDVQVIVPWTLYCQTSDKSILTKHFNAMVHYMDYMKSNERGTDQAPVSGSKNYGDWLSFQGTCVEVISDYYYGYVTQLMAKIAGIIGNTAKQTEYNQKFEAIKAKFLATHVTFTDGKLIIKSGTGNTGYQFQYSLGKSGRWEDNSQTALLWMLKLGFYDSEQMRDAAVNLLIQNIKNENPNTSGIRSQYGKNTLAVGFLGSNVITPMLTDIGYGDVSYDLLLQDKQPSWLFEVKAGATTIWERWNSYTPGVGFGDSEMNSFNHYAYGSVVEWMYRYMAGISADQADPGFKHIVLQPTIDTGVKYNSEERINSVNGSYESYYGKIESNWRSEAGKLTFYHTIVPANTTAVLYLPIQESEVAGFKTIPGISLVQITEHNGETVAEFHLDSGAYDFKVTDDVLHVAYADGYSSYNGWNVTGLYENGKITGTVSNLSGDYSQNPLMVIGVYDKMGKLLGLKTERVRSERKVDFDISLYQNADCFAIYLWESFESMKPISSQPVVRGTITKKP